MSEKFIAFLEGEIGKLHGAGLYKGERVLVTPQSAAIAVKAGREVVNFCANNYLGLADSPELVETAKNTMEEWGYGLASVRFICGTQELHKKLEGAVSRFLGTDDTILYGSCFDANGGLFETLLGSEDAVISDALNHASIIDGIRLCKAKRLRYQNNNMEDLRVKLEETRDARFRLIATDGVFSMDGVVANLKSICDLAEEYDALVMVDDSHAVGIMGENGRGSHEHCGVMGRVDILTGTFGKALGGASGGYTSGRRAIVEWLRQRSRPYLFSNTLAPAVAGGTLKALEIVQTRPELRRKLRDNSQYFRRGMEKLGFELTGSDHPIIPVMLYDAVVARNMADLLLEEGIYVIAFSYPVVPEGRARIRTQMSAAHTTEQIDRALAAFEKVGKKLGVLA